MTERDDSWLDGKYGPEGCGTSFSSSFTWSCDDRMIAFVRGVSIRIIDAETRFVIKDLDFFVDGVTQTVKPVCPRFQKDTNTLVFGHGRTLYFMSTYTWELEKSHKIVLESEEDTLTEIERVSEMNSISVQRGNCEKLTRDEIRCSVLKEYEFRHAIDHILWLEEPSRLFVSCFQGWAVLNTDNCKLVASRYNGLAKKTRTRMSSDGKLIAEAKPHSISISQANSSEVLLQDTNPRISKLSGCWSSDNSKFAYTTSDRQIFVINITTKEISRAGTYRDIYTPHIAWKVDSNCFAIHSPEEGLQVIDSSTGKLVCTYRSSALNEFQAILQGEFEWSQDGKKIVLGRRDDCVEIWAVPVSEIQQNNIQIS